MSPRQKTTLPSPGGQDGTRQGEAPPWQLGLVPELLPLPRSSLMPLSTSSAVPRGNCCPGAGPQAYLKPSVCRDARGVSPSLAAPPAEQPCPFPCPSWPRQVQEMLPAAARLAQPSLAFPFTSCRRSCSPGCGSSPVWQPSAGAPFAHRCCCSSSWGTQTGLGRGRETLLQAATGSLYFLLDCLGFVQVSVQGGEPAAPASPCAHTWVNFVYK